MECGLAPEVPRAEVTANGTTLHDVATYDCIAGYRITGGDRQLECQLQGTRGEWQGTRLMCTGKWTRSQNSSVLLPEALRNLAILWSSGDVRKTTCTCEWRCVLGEHRLQLHC